MATISAHGCEEITQVGYLPKTQDKQELFAEKQKFLYDVFITIIQTPIGKHIVRKHEQLRNAQRV